jgi:hypothetical protein
MIIDAILSPSDGLGVKNGFNYQISPGRAASVIASHASLKSPLFNFHWG